MNKNVYFVLVLLLIGSIVGYFSLYKRCKQPVENQIAITKMICVMNLINVDVKDVRKQLCERLQRPNNCDLSEKDMNEYNVMMKEKFRECVNSLLEKEKLCTDKVQFPELEKL